MKNLDVAGLLWGLVFAIAAGIGLWVGSGHSVNWAVVRFGLPIAFIALGALGLVLSRHQNRH